MLHKNLTVLHNINPDKLFKSLNNYNGIVCPSLAIIKKDTFFNEFGGATLVLDESVIFNGKDKVNKSDKESFVYLGDSWSARFPDIQYKENKLGVREFIDNFQESLSVFSEESVSSIIGDISRYPNYDEIGSRLLSSPSIMLHFLRENGINPELPLEAPKNTSEIAEFDKLNDLLRSLNGDPSKVDYSIHSEIIDNVIANTIEENKKTIKRISRFPNLAKGYEEINQKILDALKRTKDGEPIHSNIIGHEITKYSYYLRDLDNAGYSYFDSRKMLKQTIEEYNLDYKFKDYTSNINDSLFRDPKIKIGKSLHPINEDNLIKYFKREGTAGVEKTLTENVQKIRASQLRRLYSFSEINENISEIDYDNAGYDHEELSKCQSKIFSTIKSQYDVWVVGDKVNKFIMDRSKTSIQDFKYYFGEYETKMDNDTLDAVLSIRDKIYNQKVRYFEAKPVRKIQVNEIKKIVFTDDCPPKDELTQKLDDLGIKHETINANDPNAYKRAINIDIIQNTKSLSVKSRLKI